MHNRSRDEPVLDVRPAADFERLHRVRSANIPLEELADRLYELPTRTTPITIFDADHTRARWARSRLRARRRLVGRVLHGEAWLRRGPTASGPSCDRLWEPHALVIEAVAEMRAQWPTLEGRRALDIACGSGRDAVFLALSGFATAAWDVLPDAIGMCDDLADRNGVSVMTQCRDIEADPTIGKERYDLICCFNFLHRPLMPKIVEAVRPGGFVAYETFVEPQRELFGRPRRDAHLLRPAELPTWFGGWQMLASREALTGPGRFAASLVARKPTKPRRDSRWLNSQ